MEVFDVSQIYVKPALVWTSLRLLQNDILSLNCAYLCVICVKYHTSMLIFLCNNFSFATLHKCILADAESFYFLFLNIKYLIFHIYFTFIHFGRGFYPDPFIFEYFFFYIYLNVLLLPLYVCAFWQMLLPNLFILYSLTLNINFFNIYFTLIQFARGFYPDTFIFILEY